MLTFIDLAAGGPMVWVGSGAALLLAGWGFLHAAASAAGWVRRASRRAGIRAVLQRRLYGRRGPRPVRSLQAYTLQAEAAARTAVHLCAAQAQLCWKLHCDVSMKQDVPVVELEDDDDCAAQRLLVETLLAQTWALLSGPLLLDARYSEVRVRLVAPRRTCGVRRCELFERTDPTPAPCTLALRTDGYAGVSSTDTASAGGTP